MLKDGLKKKINKKCLLVSGRKEYIIFFFFTSDIMVFSFPFAWGFFVGLSFWVKNRIIDVVFQI